MTTRKPKLLASLLSPVALGLVLLVAASACGGGTFSSGGDVSSGGGASVGSTTAIGSSGSGGAPDMGGATGSGGASDGTGGALAVGGAWQAQAEVLPRAGQPQSVPSRRASRTVIARCASMTTP